MDQINSGEDPRHDLYCTYCGARPSTRDHVPSRVLLEDPYPENLPVVPACADCNNSFSLDEEYLACLIECAISASADPKNVRRPKIARILGHKPNLAQMLREAVIEVNGRPAFQPDASRVANVLKKLARGHAKFELSESLPEGEPTIHWAPLGSLDEAARKAFESPPPDCVFPEVGSRGLVRQARVVTVKLAAVNDPADEKLVQFIVGADWVEVQPDLYRYLAVVTPRGQIVRIVLSEFLAAEVIWSDDDAWGSGGPSPAT